MKKDVLIIDDSFNFRLMVMHILSRYEDFNLIGAENGVKALKEIEKRDVKLIIVDYHMPDE